MALRNFTVLVAVTVLSSLLSGYTAQAAPSSAEIISNGTETFREAGLPEPMAPMAAYSSNSIAACPAGFIHLGNSPGCYKIITEALTYDQAYQRCTAQNPAGRLAIVETPEEHKYIQDYLFLSPGFEKNSCKSQFWIGLERYKRNDCNSRFHWKKRFGTFTFQEPLGFSAFSQGEPNCKSGRDEACVQYALKWKYQWNDVNCEIKSCAVCEAPPSCTCPREGSFPF